jgi:hypothetical protein
MTPQNPPLGFFSQVALHPVATHVKHVAVSKVVANAFRFAGYVVCILGTEIGLHVCSAENYVLPQDERRM